MNDIPDDLKIPDISMPKPGELVGLAAGDAPKGVDEKSAATDYLKEQSTQLVKIATMLWRIKGQTQDKHSGDLREDLEQDDFKKIKRYLDAIDDSLDNLGIEVEDRTGQPFDYGLPLKVISTEKAPGISRDIILETLRPTVYVKGKKAQEGEIIIGTPEKKGSESEQDDN